MLVALAKIFFFARINIALIIPMARQLTLNDDDDDNLTCTCWLLIRVHFICRQCSCCVHVGIQS